MQLPASPAILGQGFQQGLAIGGELQRTALDAAQIRAQQNDLQMNQKPIGLDQFAKSIPSYLQKPMLDYAEANGVVEQNGDMKFIRASKAKELLSGFKNDMVAQAAVYEQANKMAQVAKSELQSKYDDHKSRVDAWMTQKQAEAQSAMIDDPANPGKKIVDQAKRYKIESEIKKFQTENPDAVAITKLKPQIDELGNIMMSTNTVQKTLDDRFVSLEKSLGRYTIPYMSGKMTREEAYAKNLEELRKFELQKKEGSYTPSFKIAGEAKDGPLKGQTVKIDERTSEMFVDTPKGRIPYNGGIKTAAERSVEFRINNKSSDSDDKSEKRAEAKKEKALKVIDGYLKRYETLIQKSPMGSDLSWVKAQQAVAEDAKTYILNGGNPDKIKWGGGKSATQDFNGLVNEARAAIKAGADPAKVKARLKEKGYNGSI